MARLPGRGRRVLRRSGISPRGEAKRATRGATAPRVAGGSSQSKAKRAILGARGGERLRKDSSCRRYFNTEASLPDCRCRRARGRSKLWSIGIRCGGKLLAKRRRSAQRPKDSEGTFPRHRGVSEPIQREPAPAPAPPPRPRRLSWPTCLGVVQKGRRRKTRTRTRYVKTRPIRRSSSDRQEGKQAGLDITPLCESVGPHLQSSRRGRGGGAGAA
ncbi:hypothetical protein J3R74_000541 [Puniceicoccus vermicola]